MPLTVVDCQVDKNQITITYSDPIATKREALDSANSLTGSTGGWLQPPLPKDFKHSALNPHNYHISAPGSPDFGPLNPQLLSTLASKYPSLPNAAISLDAIRTTVTMTFTSSTPPEFAPGSWVNIVIKHVLGRPEAGDERPGLEGDFVLITRQVPGGTPIVDRKVRDIEDAISYPLLTEEVGYPPSPVSKPSAGGGMPSAGGASQGLGQVAARAISDVLGWKVNATDAKGFVGSLTQSFTLTDVEGHIESKWNPKTYTVQTDLAGGITGAQASLYTRAKEAQDKCLPLLDGLYALNPSADPEYVNALRQMAKSQITEIVKQFGVVPPSILRVNTYFHILLGSERKFRFSSEPRVEADPDRIRGTLGSIRDIYGIFFQRRGANNPFSNSVEDEQNITNFRVISDYMTSLLQSWLANGRFFELGVAKIPAFLGTQLVLISRQFNVIAETVNEVRFALDSVFIGPNERQQLLLQFPDALQLPAMYLEDVLAEIDSVMTEEGPRLIKDGGRIAVNNNLLPVLQTLMNMIDGARNPDNLDQLPDGFQTARVRHSLDDLDDQLTALFALGQQVGMDIPPPGQIG